LFVYYNGEKEPRYVPIRVRSLQKQQTMPLVCSRRPLYEQFI